MCTLHEWINSFPKTDVMLKPKEQRFIPSEAPVIDEYTGMAIVKLPDLKRGGVNTI